jgi:hypothetical protein
MIIDGHRVLLQRAARAPSHAAQSQTTTVRIHDDTTGLLDLLLASFTACATNGSISASFGGIRDRLHIIS